jgi:hypothetical protein
MLSLRQNAVEFVGGPFDGRAMDLPEECEELEPFVALPVAQACELTGPIQARRASECTCPTVCTCSRVERVATGDTAIYELDSAEGETRYRFLCLTAVRPYLFEGWLL